MSSSGNSGGGGGTLPYFAESLVDKVLESVLCKKQADTPPSSSNSAALKQSSSSSNLYPHSSTHTAQPSLRPTDLHSTATAAAKSGTTRGDTTTETARLLQHQQQKNCSGKDKSNNQNLFSSSTIPNNLPGTMAEEFIYFGPGPAKLPTEVRMLIKNYQFQRKF